MTLLSETKIRNLSKRAKRFHESKLLQFCSNYLSVTR